VRGQSCHVINHEDYRTYMHTKGLKERLVRTGLRVIKFEWPDEHNGHASTFAGGHVCGILHSVTLYLKGCA